MEIKIEKGVPVPTPNAKWPLGKMEVGDSFFAEGRKVTNISATACGYGRDHGMRFACRTVTENGVKGVRVWRTA